MQLHAVVGTNAYCGPGCLSLLTGLTTDEAATVLAFHSGSRRHGTKPTVLAHAARRLGIAMSLVRDYRGVVASPSIGAVAMLPALRGGTYVVATKGAPGHLLVLQLVGPTPTCSDNKTLGQPVELTDYAYRNASVEGLWRVGPVKDFSAMLDRVQQRRALADASMWSRLAHEAEAVAYALAEAERPAPPPPPVPAPPPAPVFVTPPGAKATRLFRVVRDASGRMCGAEEFSIGG